VLFQASTIGALVDGAYEGDVTFAELAQHGDLGLGTLNAIDGEMIAVDGRFYRADADGRVNEIEPSAKTPFAVLTWFEPYSDLRLEGPMTHDGLTSRLDAELPTGSVACAVRLDGEFDYIRARSIPRQRRPYRPMDEVIADQHVFELSDVEGTVVGFRFPDYAEGVEVSGYHLHYISPDRSQGGHIFECRPRDVRVRIDPSTDLHLELPRGVELESPELGSATQDALERLEHQG
jgi:acetolactate decarboxylase